MMRLGILLALACLLAAAGCGQKGELYLPAEQPASAQQDDDGEDED